MVRRARAEAVGSQRFLARKQPNSPGGTIRWRKPVAAQIEQWHRAPGPPQAPRPRSHRLAVKSPVIFISAAMHHCFPPVTSPDTRLLILGSLHRRRLAGEAALLCPSQNQFWRLIGAVIGGDLAALDYEDRLAALLDSGIGLWDTVAAATREGSLDADIRLHEASDIAALAETLPELRAIAFNGGKSARIGRGQLAGVTSLELVDLPSSSPAYAAMPFERSARPGSPSVPICERVSRPRLRPGRHRSDSRAGRSRPAGYRRCACRSCARRGRCCRDRRRVPDRRRSIP